MLEELRLNPGSSGARTWGRFSGEAAVAGSWRDGSGLSTGFAERQGLSSTGPAGHICAAWGGMAKEKVG